MISSHWTIKEGAWRVCIKLPMKYFCQPTRKPVSLLAHCRQKELQINHTQFVRPAYPYISYSEAFSICFAEMFQVSWKGLYIALAYSNNNCNGCWLQGFESGGHCTGPTFWTCLHRKWRKDFFIQCVSHSTKSVLSMKQMLSSSIKIFASDYTRSCLRAWKYLGDMPPDPPRD